jgi:hypothetical protein
MQMCGGADTTKLRNTKFDILTRDSNLERRIIILQT